MSSTSNTLALLFRGAATLPLDGAPSAPRLESVLRPSRVIEITAPVDALLSRVEVGLGDEVADAASGTIRVRLALSNPGSDLPAGPRCPISITP